MRRLFDKLRSNNDEPNPNAEMWQIVESESSNRQSEETGEKTSEETSEETREKAERIFGDVIFSEINEDNVSAVMDVERRLYPNPRLDRRSLEAIAADPERSQYSFLIEIGADGKKVPVGYCLAGVEEVKHFKEEDKPDEEAIYIEDFGIVEEGRQGGRTAIGALESFLGRVEKSDIDLVEMEARESTSFALLVGKKNKKGEMRGGLGGRLVEKHGFKVVYDYEDSYSDSSGTYYWVGFRREKDANAEEDKQPKSRSHRIGERAASISERIAG